MIKRIIRQRLAKKVLPFLLCLPLLVTPFIPAEVHAAAPGTLTVTPASASKTIPHDKWNGDYFEFFIKNTGGTMVKDINVSISGQIA